jgi:hypothetical protein
MSRGFIAFLASLVSLHRWTVQLEKTYTSHMSFQHPAPTFPCALNIMSPQMFMTEVWWHFFPAVRNWTRCVVYPSVFSMNIFNFLNQFHYNSTCASQASRYTLTSYMYPTVTKLKNFHTKPLIFSGNVLLKDDIVWILWLLGPLPDVLLDGTVINILNSEL